MFRYHLIFLVQNIHIFALKSYYFWVWGLRLKKSVPMRKTLQETNRSQSNSQAINFIAITGTIKEWSLDEFHARLITYLAKNNVMDKIWYRNPSKSEDIGCCDGDEKTEWPRRTDTNSKKKSKKKSHTWPKHYLQLLQIY